VEFKVDENLPAETCQVLRQAGHDAVSVGDQRLGGRPDCEVADVCRRELRILVTLDTDFGNILAYPPREYPGIVVIRTADQAKTAVLRFIRLLVVALESESPRGVLWIVESNRIRVRGPGEAW
jgi:predicted nuclease of predicted toxin-antitoxin system